MMLSEVASVLAARWREGATPLVIGIGGGSGAGKSTVCSLLTEGLQPMSVSVVNLDRFFKPPEEMPTYYSSLHQDWRPDFNHPDALQQPEMIAFCQDAAGRGGADREVMVIEGILGLHFPDLRSLMHLRLYVTIQIDQMLSRRKERNLAAGYGGTGEEIDHYNLECVTPEHLRFNAPTARYADLLIPNDDGRSEDRDRMVAGICSAAHAVNAVHTAHAVRQSPFHEDPGSELDDLPGSD